MKPIEYLSICIPAYNEEGNIEEVVTSLIREGEAVSERLEILLIDDGSEDSTYEVMNTIASKDERLRLFRNDENQGIEPSLKKIFEKVRGDTILVTGADGEFPPESLYKMACMISDGYDIVVGKRVGEERRLVRRFISFIYNISLRLIFEVDTFDAGGTKLMRRRVLDSVKVISRGTFAEAERLIMAKKRGMKIGFIPVPFKKRRSGKEKGLDLKQIYLTIVDGIRFFRHLKTIKDRSDTH